jgi:pimeloyl-ACP methyl ester carboxylesterase
MEGGHPYDGTLNLAAKPGFCPVRGRVATMLLTWSMAAHVPATPEAPPPDDGGSAPDVAVSGEMFAPVSPGVELCYQTYGDPDDEPMLLVMGLATPMTWWDPELCTMLARRGYHVIVCDNRDVGRSTKVHGRVTRGMLVRAFVGQHVRAPYTISDMADDCFGLLEHLGIDSAHVVGASMGGMIAQTMAIEHPDRVRSLVSIMSTTGKRSVGWQNPRLLPVLLRPVTPGVEAYVESSVEMWDLIGSPGYRRDEDMTRELARLTYDRGLSSSGTLRQMVAILTQPNRTEALHELRMPTMVIHGLADRMVHVSGGRATAAAIPGAELLLIDGMGHDLPSQLHEIFADAIAHTAGRVEKRAGEHAESA